MRVIPGSRRIVIRSGGSTQRQWWSSPVRIGRMGSGLLVVMLAMALAGGCGQKFERSFEVAYLSYGEPGIPYGSLVVAAYAPETQWTTGLKVELARQATLLFPPPYHATDGIPYMSVSTGFKDKNSALWVATGDQDGSSRFEVSMLQRAALLWTNNPSAEAAVVLYANQAAISIRPTRFGQELVSLTKNACSVAVVRYAQPEQFGVIASATYARPSWFDDTHIGYISMSDYLIALEPDSGTADTVASGVESFSVATGTGTYAVCYKGDSIVVFGADGARQGGAIVGASVPVISPDGRWLAYHAADHGIWARELESGTAHELGVGYPVNWSGEGHLLLFFERRVNDKNEAETVFHVCDPLDGTVITLPAEGHLADAILLK